MANEREIANETAKLAISFFAAQTVLLPALPPAACARLPGCQGLKAK